MFSPLKSPLRYPCFFQINEGIEYAEKAVALGEDGPLSAKSYLWLGIGYTLKANESKVPIGFSLKANESKVSIGYTLKSTDP